MAFTCSGGMVMSGLRVRGSGRAPSRRAADRARQGHQPAIEGELEREAVEEAQDHRGGLLEVDPAKPARAAPARQRRADEPPRARVGLAVDRGQAPVVEGLAPELDEHGPEVAALHRGLRQARITARSRARASRAPRACDRHPAVEIGGHPQGGGGRASPLVAEVVVEDALAHPGLRGDPLHGEARVAVARETADGGAHDLVAPQRRPSRAWGSRRSSPELILVGRPIMFRPEYATEARAGQAARRNAGRFGSSAEPLRRRSAARSASSRSAPTAPSDRRRSWRRRGPRCPPARR